MSPRALKRAPDRVAGLRLATKLRVVWSWLQKSIVQDGLLQTLAFTLALACSLIAELVCQIASWALCRLAYDSNTCLLPWRLHRRVVAQLQCRLFFRTTVRDPHRVLQYPAASALPEHEEISALHRSRLREPEPEPVVLVQFRLTTLREYAHVHVDFVVVFRVVGHRIPEEEDLLVLV